MNRGHMDERLLFPAPVLGGLAKEVLARHMPSVHVHGVVSRSPTSFLILVTHQARRFQLGVRFVHRTLGEVFITTMHRQTRPISGAAFGMMVDDRSVFFEQMPDERIVLTASRYAFRMYCDSGLRKIAWNKPLMALELAKVNAIIAERDFSESFRAMMPGEQGHTVVVPVPDFGKHPEWVKELPPPHSITAKSETLALTAGDRR